MAWGEDDIVNGNAPPPQALGADGFPAPEPFKIRWWKNPTPDLSDHELVGGGILEGRGVAMLTGAPSAGKSWVLIDLAFGIASGTEFLGNPCKQGTVIFLAAEAGDSIGNRFYAHRLTDRGKVDLPLGVIPHGIKLGDDQTVMDFANEVKAHRPAAIMIDTLSRSIVGLDENSVEDMGKVVENLYQLHYKTGALVIFSHHLGKNRDLGARGHSVLLANTDAELRVEAGENGIFTFSVLRQRNGGSGASINFRLDVIKLGVSDRGNDVTSCLIRRVSEGWASEPEAEKPRGTIAEAMLRELNNLSCQDAYRVAIPMRDGVPAGTYGTLRATWKASILKHGIIASDGKNVHSQFNNTVSRMVSRQVIRIVDELVWPVSGG